MNLEKSSCFHIILPLNFLSLGLAGKAGIEAICSFGLVDDKDWFFWEKLKSRNTSDSSKNRGLVEDSFFLPLYGKSFLYHLQFSLHSCGKPRLPFACILLPQGLLETKMERQASLHRC